MEKDPDLIYVKSWMPDQYYEVGVKIFAESLVLAAVVGVMICVLIRFVKKHL